MQLDPEWQALDFQRDVRATQLRKLAAQQEQIAQIGDQLQENNEQNLAQIDQSYKETAELERKLIAKKMENMNLINDSEMEGIKFLQQFGECTRDSESLNTQINQIQLIIAMLQNELSLAEVEEDNMKAVDQAEQNLLREKEAMTEEDEHQVSSDIKLQTAMYEKELEEMESVQTKQKVISKNLSDHQEEVIGKMEKQSQDLELQRERCQKEKAALQAQVREAKKQNEERKNANAKLEGEIIQLQVKIDVMEDNLDKIVFENVEQFESFQDIIHENNANINGVRSDYGSVQKQHFEMLNINESLEQRIDQLKGQRDLSILLTKSGLENDLKSQQLEANSTSQKLISLLNNTELSWDDKLIVKMRELDDAMRQASEQSVNKQVQKYLQKVRDQNKDIVIVTQAKEEIESKMKNDVNEQELKELQEQHSALIKEYESIIKDKIDIFTEMIKNLTRLSDGNYQSINNEEKIAEQKLAIEIWDRDIYQKKRVSMDVVMEQQNVLSAIQKEDESIRQRDDRIVELEQELQDADVEFQDIHEELEKKDGRIQELQDQIQTMAEEKARLQAEEEERRRREEEEMRARPKERLKYQPVKGDKVDERMAAYINNFDLDVPLQRLGDGQYIFGQRKIFAKMQNDKLVIRVGGGFMLIDEFLQTYGQQELDKLNGKAPQGSFSGVGVSMGSPQRRGSPNASSVWGRVGAAGRQSPTANRQSPNGSRMKF